ncbi:SDR family oxidoreductase [bacterium]|nr:SDR family oxidoreductase [bacterium]
MPYPFPPPNGPEFDNCNFWITGATSGMGLAIAQRLATLGASLWIMARNEANLQATAQQLRLAGAKNVITVALDLTRPHLYEYIRRQVDKVTFRGVLINGGGPHGGKSLDFSAADYDQAHALLLRGPALLLQALLPQLEPQTGSVVAISSTTVKELNPYLPLSGAYRAGFSALLKAFAEELGKRGIRVNSIAPGYVRTEKLQDLQAYEAQQQFGSDSPEAQKKIADDWAALSPMNRLIETSEIADLCLFLFSTASYAITGQTLVADAGQLRLY